MAGLFALGALVLVVAWSVWTVYSVANDLDEVESKGLLLRQELIDGDADGARRALTAYQDAAESAESGTSGPTWWLVEKLPIWGDDAAAIDTVSGVLADLGRDALPPLVAAAEEVTAKAFQPEGAKFPLDAIEDLKRPAADSEAAFADADAALRDEDTRDYIGLVRERYDDLREMVLDARAALDSAYRAAELMPTLLGADRPRNYLLVFQNNAELRSTGGLAGSVLVVHADGGQVQVVSQEATANLGERDQPLPLTKEERSVFGDQLGKWFLNANLTPDFPRTAELMRDRWEEARSGPIDGVFLVDPVSISYLLKATGEIEVPGYQPVNADNVVALVENEIYRRSADRFVHDAYQTAVADAVFEEFANGAGNPAAIISGLVDAVLEGRIRMHSFEPEVQKLIAGTEIAGEFPAEPSDQAAVGVYVNDSTQSKMSYYLEYDSSMVVQSCTGGVQDLKGTVVFKNNTPDAVDTLPPAVTGVFDPKKSDITPGQQVVLVYLMSPIGGQIREIEFDGRELDRPILEEYKGRQVATLGMYLDPEQEQVVDFTMRTGPGQTGAVHLDVTPNAQPGTESETLRTACF